MGSSPIFILGAHKSGTSLLRSLFDSHSELAVVPKEFHPFQIMGYWVSYSYAQQRPLELTVDDIRSNAWEWVHRFNTYGSKFADADLRGQVDEERFREELRGLRDESSLAERIEILLNALYSSTMGNSPAKGQRILHKTVGLGEFAPELHQAFPSARFVHLVRDPYRTLRGWRRFQLGTSGTFPLMDRMVGSLKNNFYFLFRNRSLIPNYKVLRYEDLVHAPWDMMKELSDFLDIGFEEETMLTPSSMGKAWEGNSTTGEALQGVQASPAETPGKGLYPFEIDWVNRALGSVLSSFSYEGVERQGSIWKRAKGESPKRYLYNRFHLLSERDRSVF
jgi:protein-tyrosine sulfotransferase